MNQPTQTSMERPRRINKNKWSGPCIYKIREVKSPIGNVVRGHRILVAVPNMDGNRPFQNIPAASFARSYMIFQTSDYNENEIAVREQAVIKELRRRGFTRIETALQFEIRMLRNMGWKVDDEGALITDEDNQDEG